MEGFIFKNNNMLENLYSFKNKKPNVVMLAAEKYLLQKKGYNLK